MHWQQLHSHRRGRSCGHSLKRSTDAYGFNPANKELQSKVHNASSAHETLSLVAGCICIYYDPCVILITCCQWVQHASIRYKAVRNTRYNLVRDLLLWKAMTSLLIR
jgi:hypothetical protein